MIHVFIFSLKSHLFWKVQKTVSVNVTRSELKLILLLSSLSVLHLPFFSLFLFLGWKNSSWTCAPADRLSVDAGHSPRPEEKGQRFERFHCFIWASWKMWVIFKLISFHLSVTVGSLKQGSTWVKLKKQEGRSTVRAALQKLRGNVAFTGWFVIITERALIKSSRTVYHFRFVHLT